MHFEYVIDYINLIPLKNLQQRYLVYENGVEERKTNFTKSSREHN